MLSQKRFLSMLLLLLSLNHSFVNGMNIGGDSQKEAEDDFEDNDLAIDLASEEERLFVIPAITLNISSLATALPIALALATSVASLLATVALAAVVFSLFGKYKYDGGYGGSYSGYGNTGGYTSYSTSSYRSLFNPDMIDWEKFSILDLISAGEEIWEKFDPTDFDCQKRLICEIHQNTFELGYAAEKIVDIFSYLTYTKIAKLPEELEELIDELLDAASSGLINKRDCGDLFPDCKFSIKKMASKYSKNKV